MFLRLLRDIAQLVAYLNGVQEVVGSNPAVPTGAQRPSSRKAFVVVASVRTHYGRAIDERSATFHPRSERLVQNGQCCDGEQWVVLLYSSKSLLPGPSCRHRDMIVMTRTEAWRLLQGRSS